MRFEQEKISGFAADFICKPLAADRLVDRLWPTSL